MLHIINADNRNEYYGELSSMHRRRREVFVDKLGWNLNCVAGMEFDEFDTSDATYLLLLNDEREVTAGTRLIPTTAPYLLGQVFRDLIDGDVPNSEYIWESSRFFTVPGEAPKNATGLLMAGMLEFGLAQGLKNYVSVSDTAMEFIIRSCGWATKRLGKTHKYANGEAAGEILDVSYEALRGVISRNNLPDSGIVKNLSQITITRKEAA